MTTDCPERRRLAAKVLQTVAALYALKDQKDSCQDGYASLSILLNQARTSERNAARAFRDHIEEHGCSEE
jgi:hypothetical protein